MRPSFLAALVEQNTLQRGSYFFSSSEVSDDKKVSPTKGLPTEEGREGPWEPGSWADEGEGSAGEQVQISRRCGLRGSRDLVGYKTSLLLPQAQLASPGT